MFLEWGHGSRIYGFDTFSVHVTLTLESGNRNLTLYIVSIRWGGGHVCEIFSESDQGLSGDRGQTHIL